MSHLPPEVQAQLDEQKKNCIFCKIISGQMQGKKAYEDKHMIGLLDINPCVKGHVLLMPKEHYPILPFLPPETFRHMFGKLPEIVGAVKKAMLTTGANILIANGAASGQQSPHFLIHMIPRENGDGIYKFEFSRPGQIEPEKKKQAIAMLAQNIPSMMHSHLQSNPAGRHTGNTKTAGFLEDIKKRSGAIYEDEKILITIPACQMCPGHMVIHSNEEEREFENLCPESGYHLFQAASYCATAVFEGLRAEGSNIVLKSGLCDDNPDGRLCIHVIPRYSNDGMNLLCEPMKTKPDLDKIASKIKEETFVIEHSGDKKKECEIIDLDKKEDVMIIGDETASGEAYVNEKKAEKTPDPLDEVRHAIRTIRDG